MEIEESAASATMSARRPLGSGSSVRLAHPAARSSRRVPRAIVSAVSDWRPSSGTIGAADGEIRLIF